MSQITLNSFACPIHKFTDDFMDKQGVLVVCTQDLADFVKKRHANYDLTVGKVYYVRAFYSYGFDIYDDEQDYLELYAEDAEESLILEYVDTNEIGAVTRQPQAEKVTEVTIAPDVSELSTDQLIRIISLHDSAVKAVSERINPIMGKICDFVGTKFTEEEIPLDAENDKA